MSARTKARKRAVDILYSSELRERPLAEALSDEAIRASSEPSRAASWGYAREIVAGVDLHQRELDTAIELHATAWPLDRMPAVDRAILRVATWEILYNPDVPDGVAISEAVEAASELSTDDSGSFVNGVLSAIARSRG